MGIAVATKQNSCSDLTAVVQAQALPDYEFVKWSDGFTDNPHTIFVTSDTTITAEFRKIGTSVDGVMEAEFNCYSRDGILYIEG